MTSGKTARKKPASRKSPTRKTSASKSKARGKRGPSGRRSFVPLAVASVATALLLLASLAVIFYVRARPQKPGPPSPPPVKAETKPSETAQKIAALDNFLYGSLFMAGLSRDRIAATRRDRRSANGQIWEVKTIDVSLPESVSIQSIKTYFSNDGPSFPPGVSRKFTQNKDDLLTLDLMLNGTTTHHIIFSKPKLYASLPPPQKMKPPPAPEAGRVAIIIDDMGLAIEPAQEILELNVPLALSVFPLAPYSREIAEMAHARGYPVMLHLPLEPHDYPRTDPGPGALFTTMDYKTMMAQITADINSVPYIKGVNNHMGSRFTESESAMARFLQCIKDRGLFFVDSRTTPLTVAHRMAVGIGVPSAERKVFLDNEQKVDSILAKIDELGQIAMNEGKAIGIGHPRPTTIAALRKGIPRLLSLGLNIVPVSDLLE